MTALGLDVSVQAVVEGIWGGIWRTCMHPMHRIFLDKQSRMLRFDKYVSNVALWAFKASLHGSRKACEVCQHQCNGVVEHRKRQPHCRLVSRRDGISCAATVRPVLQFHACAFASFSDLFLLHAMSVNYEFN